MELNKVHSTEYWMNFFVPVNGKKYFDEYWAKHTHYCGGKVVNQVCQKCLEATDTEDEFRIADARRAHHEQVKDEMFSRTEERVWQDPAQCLHINTDISTDGTEGCKDCGRVLVDYSSSAEYEN